jgi:hypothetical protein
VQLGLEEDPPPAGPDRIAGVPIEGAVDLAAEDARGVRVRCRRPRAQEQLAVEDLRDLVLGRGEDVLVGRLALGIAHGRETSIHGGVAGSSSTTRDGT